jgi:DNA-binding MarR family transcriptional regulator
MTRAPRATILVAIAAPIPLVAPVIKQVRSWRVALAESTLVMLVMLHVYHEGAGVEKADDGGRPGSAPTAETLAFEGGTGFLLARTGAIARQQWGRMLAERRLTPHQFAVLAALHEKGAIGQRRLSALIGIDPRNVVPIIDSLVERGLVGRTVDPGDRRRRVLALTASGHGAIGDLNAAGAEIERHFFRTLPVGDRRALHRILLALLAANPK